jgi:assimilatory nitrate reductase catalytic subunit
MSRTGLVPQLFAHAPEPAVELNANDMARRGVKEGELVHVTSRRGTQVLPARAAGSVVSGRAFIAMHWGEEFLSGGAQDGTHGLGVNALTSPAIDPLSKQPELKHAAVKIVKAALPWRMVAFGFLAEDTAWCAQTELASALKQVGYASLTRFGRARCGVLLRAAHHEAPPPEWLEHIALVLGVQRAADVLHYADKRAGIERRIKLARQADGVVQVQSALLVGDMQAEGWLKAYLENGESVASLGRLLLAPGAVAPAGFSARGKTVCSCFDVREEAIARVLESVDGSSAARLAAVQAQLKCGTNCGSCVPELKRMVI